MLDNRKPLTTDHSLEAYAKINAAGEWIGGTDPKTRFTIEDSRDDVQQISAPVVLLRNHASTTGVSTYEERDLPTAHGGRAVSAEWMWAAQRRRDLHTEARR